MDIQIFPTATEASIYSAQIIEQILLNQHHPVLGLATGSTPIPLYRELIAKHKSGLDFSHVSTINLDEYVGLSADHPQSYRYFMIEHLFNKINVDRSKAFYPNGIAKDLQQECDQYDDIIRSNPIDLLILGIGTNGHIGFNEPGSSLKTTTHIVKLAQETINANARFFNNINDVPTHAITMGMQSIFHAKQIILLAFGEQKSSAVLESVTGNIQTSLPASILQLHPNVTFVLDQQAGKLLNSTAIVASHYNNKRQ
jgi:glucosamine-6-phosphate deaminase